MDPRSPSPTPDRPRGSLPYWSSQTDERGTASTFVPPAPTSSTTAGPLSPGAPRRTSPISEFRTLPRIGMDRESEFYSRDVLESITRRQSGGEGQWTRPPGSVPPAGRVPQREPSFGETHTLKTALASLATSRHNRFTTAAHADLLKILFTSLWGGHPSLFLLGSVPSTFAGFNLTQTQAQAVSSGVPVDVKGKGKEREWLVKPGGEAAAAVPSTSASSTGRGKCEKGFEKGEVIYRCKNCSVSEYFALLCTTCFNSSSHVGHTVNVKVATGPGEYCSCGDSEVFKIPLVCSSHEAINPTPPLPPLRTSSDPPPQTSRFFPPEPSLLTLTNPSPRRPSASSPSTSTASPHLPFDLQEAIKRTVSTVLDYVLDTLDFSPEETALPKSEEALKMQPTAETTLSEWEKRDGARRTYAVVLWNDEKHTREDVVVQLGDAAGWGDSAGWDCAEKLHTEGRDIIETSDNVPRLLHIAHTLSQIDLGVTLRSSHDTFRESVSAVMISFLLDLCTSTVASSPTLLRKFIADELFAPRNANSDRQRWRQKAGLDRLKESSRGGFFNSFNTESFKSKPVAKMADYSDAMSTGSGELSRLDWLLVYHTKLWKRPRAEFQQLFTRLLMVEDSTRLEMAQHFAKVFHRLIDLFLFVDRESEHCTATLAAKLFGIPSVASHIVDTQDLLTRYLQVLQAFYTNQFPHKRILLPPPNVIPRVDPESEAFKMKKAAPLFSHLKDLLSSEGVQAQIAQRPDQITPLLELFSIFTCMNSNVRATSSHVEYESEAWIKAFQVSGELGRVARAWGESYAFGEPKDLLGAIETTARRIGEILRFENDTLDVVKFRRNEYHSVRFGVDGKEYGAVEFDVASQHVSFHNPLHWLLAGMLKQVALADGFDAPALLEVLTQLGTTAPGSGSVPGSEQEKWILLLMDFPLRVVVYVAQLRNGLWVRNGQSMRQQHHHYREHTALGVREVAWDNDIFLLQVAFCILDPNLVLVTLLDRFRLVYWFSGDMDHAIYTHPAAGMVEEFLLLLIVCLSEPCNIAAWSLERFVRREVTHALVLGSSTYSELTKKLPERANDCPQLGSILDEVATYKAPETATDFGSYELKDECFVEIDPLFHHYSRNQKQEVEEILEKRYEKQSGGKKDYIHVPSTIEIPPGPYQTLPLAFKSPLLPQIVFFTLHNLIPLHRLANKEGPSEVGKARESQESVIELALHLAMLCLQHEPLAFANEASNTTFGTVSTLVSLLEEIEEEELFKNVKQRAVWCLDAIVFHFSGVHRTKEAPPPKPSSTAAASTPRKLKAKARQEAIMQKFSKDQQAFLDAHGDEDDEMEDEHDEEEIVYGACMVCQEDCTSNVACGSMALVQPSKLIRYSPMNSLPWLEESIRVPTSLDRLDNFPPPPTSNQPPTSSLPDAFPRNNFKFGLYTSTCGHLMHLNCFESYTKTTESRHHAQAARNHPENVARREFNCPLCKSLGNVLLPMQNPYDRPGKPIKNDDLPLRDWLRFINTEALRDVPDTAMMFQHRTETGELPPLFADASPVVSVPESEKSTLFEPSRKMLGDLYAVVRPISQQSAHLRGRAPPESLMQERPTQGMYLPDELVAWTIAGLEITQRGQEVSAGSTVADSLNVPTTQLLKCLLGSLRLAAFSSLGGSSGLVSARYGLFARLLPEWYRDNKISTPVLLRDPLGILVEGAAIAFEYLQPILILTYYAELCRAVIGMLHLIRSFPGRPMAWLRVGAVDASHAREIFGDVRQLIGGMCSHSRILQFEVTEYLLCLPDEILGRLLYAHTLPFVRRAAILHRVVKSNQPSSSNLASASMDTLPDTASEYLRLLTLLNIPLPSATLSPPPNSVVSPTTASITDTVSSYLKQFSAFYGPRSQTSLVRLEYPAIYSLARLPNSLEEVFEKYGRRVCANCGTVPQGMAVCFFCGEGVCVGVSCCREDVIGGAEGLGECNLHMRKCNAPIGVFLDLRKWQILWLWAGSGSWGPNVYLDIHGELDQSMKRGFFQYLNQPRLDDIRKAWLTHGIPSFVARKMESLLDGGGWGAF
ncbi:hypothetical protein BDY24DRAFT_383763 [Mrakia frigida]|uniref:uncharacterized protein n=1 Tax=Mrakia frigida TaxID=29902 RepID=UPI003FCC1D06